MYSLTFEALYGDQSKKLTFLTDTPRGGGGLKALKDMSAKNLSFFASYRHKEGERYTFISKRHGQT